MQSGRQPEGAVWSLACRTERNPVGAGQQIEGEIASEVAQAHGIVGIQH
jgi:hypothetical protein